ncbi:MAG TPA: phage resistance protein, partial [Micrococcales bacterium]|nr:phage resistance protein [Micrococcales bacterium]
MLQLGTGVTTKAAATLSEYVVTEAITGAFADALDLVAAATARGDAKGAFIHGSFGAGKSHFMAVLNLLLAGNPHARTLPGLAPVIADRGDLLAKRYLTLDYHLLGKESLEHALFEGYLRAVAVRHPDVKPPVLHRSGALLVDAAGLRATLGEERFFESLGGADDGWGTQSAGWDAASYEAAEALPPGD